MTYNIISFYLGVIFMKKLFMIFVFAVIALILIKSNIFQFDDYVKIEKTMRCSDEKVEWLLQIYNNGDVSIQPIGAIPKNVIIPESIEGYTVNQIADYAFAGYTELRTVECPATITYVGDYAFLDCDNLVSVVYSAEHVDFGTDVYGKK